jgi:hypothetical protein
MKELKLEGGLMTWKTGSETAPRLAGSMYLSVAIFVCKRPKIDLDKLEIYTKCIMAMSEVATHSHQKCQGAFSIQHYKHSPSTPLLCSKKEQPT